MTPRRDRLRHVGLVGAPSRLDLRPRGVPLALRLAAWGLVGPALLAVCLHDRWGLVGLLLAGEVSVMPAVWIALLFLTALAGCGFFAHTVMRALGPRFALATVQPARRGAAATLQWRASGVTPTIRSLRLELVGREEADYQRPAGGASESGTEKRELYRRELVRLSRGDRSALSHGSVGFELPPFAFSFDGGRNRLRWLVVLSADVAAWADVREELELDIAP